MAPRHLTQGQAGEAVARRHLEALGYKVLDTNWRIRQGELDIVCLQGRTVVFVEVKTRAAGGMTAPGEALTRKKQQRLAKAASAYLSSKGWWERPCRFDLITVVMADHGSEVEHSIDVFDLTDALDRSHSAWQPW